MAGNLEKKEVLIVVRTYPTPAKKGVEVSCTAGITKEGKWIRLFPIPYRFLEGNQHFHKYQWIEASVHKATSDTRPESYKLVGDPSRFFQTHSPQRIIGEQEKRYCGPSNRIVSAVLSVNVI